MDHDSESEQLASPWLIAVWPGMGHVAMNAGFYLAAKLEMRVFAEFLPRELYDVDHVEVVRQRLDDDLDYICQCV